MYKNKLSKTLLLALGLGMSLSVSARERLDLGPEGSGKNQSAGRGNKISAACLTSSSSASLDINNVRAMVLNGGDMWWNLFDARYEVPKVNDPNLPKRHSIFAGAVWIGGRDPQNNLYLAAQTYRQGTPPQQNYWPGPLDNNGQITPEDCAAWNYHAKIDKSVIDKFRNDYAAGAFASQDENLLPKAIKDWPAKNNPVLVRSGMKMNMELAPFVNVGGDPDAYEPLLGDYPDFRGDQGIWWVMNDAGGVKEPLSKQIGLELQVLAFAFQTNDLINNMTFYKQILKNKGNNILQDTYLGQWVDPDLGFYNDDFVGCDVARGLGICYNGDNDDQGANGYGLNPPAVGVDFFQGPTADANDGIDNDRDGVVDEPGEKIIMSSFIYYNNDSNVTNGNPRTASDFYNYLRAIWRDGKTITFGGDGTNQSAIPYKFMFPGDSDPKGYGASNPPTPNFVPPFQGWTEYNTQATGNVSNTPADRRFLQSAGPFTLQPGSVNELTIGVVWARANSGGAQGSLGLLKFADDRAQKLFDNDFLLPQGPDAPELAITELDQQLVLTLLPRTFRTSSGDVVTTETYCEQDRSLLSNPAVKDPTYCFEGYKIYQLKDLTVSASELDNRDRARLVAQADVKNGITSITNYVFDADVNQLVPRLKVTGADQGIFHTINVTTDLFATGNDRIVNFKSYHYLVVAYAYNGDPANVEDKYLEGRRVSVETGIPHKNQAENGGTILNSAYGTGAAVTRVFGTGNGGNVLAISQEEQNNIFNNKNEALLDYMPNQGPFKVKVYDPKKVKGEEFKVKMSSRLEYLVSSKAGAALAVNDTILSTGDFSKPNVVTPTAPNKISGPHVPGRAIVRRIVGTRPVLNAAGATIDQIVTLDVEMLNDHIFGTFVANVEKYKTENPGSPDPKTSFEGYFYEDRPFRSLNSNFTAVATNFALNDFWKLTFQSTGREIRGDRPVSEFNEQLVIDPQTNEPYGIALEFQNVTDPGFRVNTVQLNGFQTASLTYNGGQRWYEGVPNGTASATTLPWLMKKATSGSPNPELTNIDPNYNYLNVLNGTWAPYAVTERSPTGPAYNNTTESNRKLYTLHNVNVVITSDKSKWSRVPVVQYTGGHPKRNLTKINSNVPSVNKDGQPDGSVSPYNNQPSKGMGWFPGYAVDLDRGIRLNMMFSEEATTTNANNAADPGRNLIWDPTTATNGGKHFIYVMDTEYNEGRDLDYHFDFAEANLNPNLTALGNYIQENIYDKAIWVGYPRLAKGTQLLASDLTVRLRVNRSFMSYNPAGQYNVTASNKPTTYKGNFNPEYNFNTNGLVPSLQVTSVATSALDQIRVVPNPYYAYSEYEQRQLDNIVKFTNLPRKCKIQIFTLNGVLVKTFNKDDSRTYLDWNLKNENNLTIASGAYIINVDAGAAGNKVLKFFGILRPIDLDSF